MLTKTTLPNGTPTLFHTKIYLRIKEGKRRAVGGEDERLSGPVLAIFGHRVPNNNQGEIEMISFSKISQHRTTIRLVVPDFSFGLFSNRAVGRRLIPKNALRKAVGFAEGQKRAKRDVKLLQTRCKDDLNFFLNSRKVPSLAR